MIKFRFLAIWQHIFMNLRECVTHMHLPSTNKAAHSFFETQRRHHQKSKTRVSVAPQKGLMSSKKIKKKEEDFWLQWMYSFCSRQWDVVTCAVWTLWISERSPSLLIYTDTFHYVVLFTSAMLYTTKLIRELANYFSIIASNVVGYLCMSQNIIYHSPL